MAPPDKQDERSIWRDVDSGWAMTVELLTATFVWGGFGWLVDRWLDTEPWFMVSGFVVGFGLGMYLVILRAADMDRSEQARRDAAD